MKPFGNCYWVEPGRLLAGEYPYPERVQDLLSAGITCFVDLTRPGELPPYDSHLRTLSQGADYIRFPITDHGTPQRADEVIRALNAIDAAVQVNRKVYVHCRAGIGRTGTIVGCFLVRHGLTGEAALEKLNELWLGSERSSTWPHVPETPEQIAYILNWRESISTLAPHQLRPDFAAPLDRYRGAILGLAIGDALGSRPSSKRSQQSQLVGGSSVLRPGPDTAMVQCVAESLLDCAGVDLEDQLQRYSDWQADAEPSDAAQSLVDVPELQRALATWRSSRKPLGSSHDPRNRNPHTLARTLAVAMYYFHQPTRVIDEAAEVSRATLQSPLVLDACRVFATVLLNALHGKPKPEVLDLQTTPAALALRSHFLKPETVQLVDGRWRRLVSMPESGDALALVGNTLRVFDRTTTFAEGVLLAVNESPTAGHAGAVFGALAGAHYGVQGIPADWRSALSTEATLMTIAEQLLRARDSGTA